MKDETKSLIEFFGQISSRLTAETTRLPKNMQKTFRRVFIEITNICNLKCGFCAAISRPAAYMTLEMFETVASQVKPFAKVVSLHLMGEPFMHPRLPEILRVCSRLGLRVNLVTNGTLLDKFGPAVFGEKCLSQVTFSLHALAALPAGERLEKLRRLTEFAKSKPGPLIAGFRLRGGREDPFVKETSAYLLSAFSGSSPAGGKGGAVTLAENIYLNFGALFEWPGRSGKKVKKGCLGLRHHFAVLCGGEVVPCCADYDGNLSIGNINKRPLADILSGPEAAALRDSIAAKTPMPAYCATCGFNAPS